MACLINKDFPFRVKFPSGNVVHAAYKRVVKPYRTTRYDSFAGGRTTVEIPEHEGVFLACKYSEVPAKNIVENTETITCQHCQRALGFLDDDADGVAFVLMKLETDEFFRHNANCNWVGEVAFATLYKKEGDARQRGFLERYYNIVTGERIPYREYWQRTRDMDRDEVRQTYKRVHEFAEDLYKVRRVKVTLVE